MERAYSEDSKKWLLGKLGKYFDMLTCLAIPVFEGSISVPSIRQDQVLVYAR